MDEAPPPPPPQSKDGSKGPADDVSAPDAVRRPHDRSSEVSNVNGSEKSTHTTALNSSEDAKLNVSDKSARSSSSDSDSSWSISDDSTHGGKPMKTRMKRVHFLPPRSCPPSSGRRDHLRNIGLRAKNKERLAYANREEDALY